MSAEIMGSALLAFLLLATASASGIGLKLRWNEQEGFLTDIKVGTPGSVHTFRVSNYVSTFYVFGEDCRSCTNTSTRFSPKSSSTFKAGKEELYSSDPQGYVYGVFGQDQLALGAAVLDSQPIGVVNRQEIERNRPATPRIASGTLGLGPFADKDEQYYPARLYDAVGGANVTFRVDDDGQTAEVLLGPQSSTKCSADVGLNKEFLRRINPNTWDEHFEECIKLSKVTVNGQEVVRGTVLAVLSMNTESWAFSRIDVLIRQFGAVGRALTVNCGAAFPEVQLLIGGRTYTVPGKALVKKLTDGSCILNVSSDAPRILIGKSFFQYHCVSYDNQNNILGISKAL